MNAEYLELRAKIRRDLATLILQIRRIEKRLEQLDSVDELHHMLLDQKKSSDVTE